MDLAAPFGPVTGLTTTVRFTDLLGLETAPGQTATIASINPGILVENGVIRYQLLPDQLVKVERGEWPFMGGRLILRETVLNFGRPSAKRLTFEVVGFDAKTFVDSLGFEGIEITGTFDGVLPMIFDEEGGRIVGGRLDSRPPGGEFAYTGHQAQRGHDGRARLRSAQQHPLPVDDHPPRRRPGRRIRDAVHDRRRVARQQGRLRRRPRPRRVQEGAAAGEPQHPRARSGR